MKKFTHRSVISILALVLAGPLFGQVHSLRGILIDKSNNTPVIGGIVILKELPDTTKQHSAVADNNGNFVIPNLKSKSYRMTIQNMGYRRITQTITVGNQDLNLGVLNMETQSQVLKEVVVQGQSAPVVQKGDTTEMNSSAYKTNPDATAEDLVKKMPGITVESGTLKAHGEEVKKVLVDGKQFFGDDPSTALKNLPADVIDKVQIYNKLSDQSELTGVDDGNSSKTLNIITKQNRRSGKFGKFVGGTDFNDKYLLNASLNIFKGNQRITILGNLNNINQQNFASLDMMGSSSRGGGGGGEGAFNSGQSGITRTKSAGINYNDNWGKKITVNGSYFYNYTDNSLVQETNTEYLLVTDGKYANTQSSANTVNYNHRLNMRIEYKIDSLNTLLIMPRINTQTNDVNSNTLYQLTGGSVNTTTLSNSITDATSYSLSNDLIFRHKFMKPRRTLSLGITTTKTNKESKNTQIASVDNTEDNQYTSNHTNGYTYSANLTYSEPVTTYGMVMVNLSSSNNGNKTNKETFDLGDNNTILDRIDSLSNVYDNNYITNRGGASYVIRKGNLNFNAGVDYQQSTLKGNQTFPEAGKVSRDFENFLPSMMLRYKFSNTSNLRIFYRTSTNAPSITQLQEVIDNSNRLSLSTGNPDLKQEYSQNLMSNFFYANTDKGINSFLMVSGTYTQDNIGNRTIYAENDTLSISQYNVVLQPGASLTVPVNLDYSYSLRTLWNFGIYAKPIQSNINLLTGFNYSQSPGYIDSLLNRANTYSITNSLIVASNISEKLDFSISYTSNYSIVDNTIQNSKTSNTKYWYQSANFKINWIFFHGFVLATDIAGQNNRGLSSNTYNQNSVVWNGSLGKKFLKNNAAEIKFSVNDILNQNKNISRTVTASSIQDTRKNTFPRYFMVTFTYNLKKFNGQKEPEDRKFGPRDGMQMGPPPDGGSSGQPSGPPPGGMPGGGGGPGM